MVASFLVFLALIVAVGISSSFKSRATKHDYYLASSSVPPWLVGLSAVATNNSGYMFIGVIGYTYSTGLAAFWLMIGWLLGDLIASFVVHGRVRKAAQETGEASYVGLLSVWGGSRYLVWQRVGALIALLFLMAYTSAQLVAGSKALHVLFEWPIWTGAVIGAVIVALYCMAGGIRASIWTDAAQSIVMIGSMAVLLVVAVSNLGGLTAAQQSLQSIDGYMDWLPQGLALPGLAGLGLFILGWAFAGFSVIGQPHVMVRFMTLNSVNNLMRMRLWYYLWFTAFYFMATAVGLLSRVYLSDTASFDAELALPTMAVELLPPVMVGLIIAGIFAATMSTADSLVLSCSAAVTHDLLPQNIEKPALLKAMTVVITAAALVWALLNEQSVFSLVIFSWSALGAAFGALLLIWCFGGRPSQNLALLVSLSGLITALAWRWFGLHSAVYEGLPGISVGLLIYTIATISTRVKPKTITN
ncbi:MAG: sodium/proline symporter [Salinisphaeraceae bacterium]|nr:sodium/proline symporter [Salinisphaeraceae bacterium]